MIRLAAATVLMLMAPLATAADPAVPPELVGIWKLESTSFKGGVFTDPEATAWVIFLEDGQFVSKGPKDLLGGTVAADVSASPAALDYQVALKSGPQRSWTNLAVYQIDGDELVISKAMEGKNRPTSLMPHVDCVVQRYRRSPTR